MRFETWTDSAMGNGFPYALQLRFPKVFATQPQAGAWGDGGVGL